jgi:hypothetical protein
LQIFIQNFILLIAITLHLKILEIIFSSIENLISSKP